MSYSKEDKDWLGRERTEHFDDSGNKIGTSKEGKDWLGRERTEHFDDYGNKIGTSKEGKDWLGRERTEHFDDSGNKIGTSKVEKDIFGIPIVQHYDNQGNKTKYTKSEKNWLGQTIFRHRSGGSGDGFSGIIAVIILITLIVVAILGTFSYPYKLIDSNISPYHLDWTSNENVWIFCLSIWICILTTIILLKKIFANRFSVLKLDEEFLSTIYILVLFFSTLSIIIQYVIKSKFSDNFLLISIISAIIISGINYLIFQKSKFKIYVTLSTIIISTIGIIYINSKNNIIISIINIPNSNVSLPQNTNTNVIIDSETSLNKERVYVKNQLQKFENATNQEKLSEYKELINYYSNQDLNVTQSVRYYELGSIYGRAATIPFYDLYYDSLTKNFIDKSAYEKYIDSALYFDKKTLELNQTQIYALNNLCSTTIADIRIADEINYNSFSKTRNEKEFSDRLLYIISNVKWVLLYDTKKDKDKLDCKNYIIEAAFNLTNAVDKSNISNDKGEFHKDAIQIMKQCSNYLDKLTKFTLLNPDQYILTKKEYGL